MNKNNDWFLTFLVGKNKNIPSQTKCLVKEIFRKEKKQEFAQNTCEAVHVLFVFSCTSGGQ